MSGLRLGDARSAFFAARGLPAALSPPTALDLGAFALCSVVSVVVTLLPYAAGFAFILWLWRTLQAP